MKTIIYETTRPNGVRVVLEDYKGPDGRIIFKVKDYYSDGSQRDCKFFDFFSSARSCFNRIVEQENTEQDKMIHDEPAEYEEGL
tara:strand:- start:56 stop:307 length:252 start_codon:yes stop_codon:yes gene_type:complete